MGKMKDELIGYLDEVVLPTVKGYGTLTAEEQNDLFALVQDQLLDNGQITVSAMSSATGSEATFTLDDLEQWSLTKQGLTLRELAGRTRLTPTRAGVVTERFFVCWYCPHETTNENEKHFC